MEWYNFIYSLGGGMLLGMVLPRLTDNPFVILGGIIIGAVIWNVLFAFIKSLF